MAIFLKLDFDLHQVVVFPDGSRPAALCAQYAGTLPYATDVTPSLSPNSNADSCGIAPSSSVNIFEAASLNQTRFQMSEDADEFRL